MLTTDLRLSSQGRLARLTNRIDDDTLRFERELLESGASLSVPQRQIFLQASPREFLLFQMRDAQGRAVMQVAMSVYRPARLKKVGRAIAARYSSPIDATEESEGLKLLSKLCTQAGGLLTVRIQPVRVRLGALDEIETRARAAGFDTSSSPLSYTRTLIHDLSGTIEEVVMRLSKRTRAKSRHRARHELDLRALTDPKYIPQCRAALQASFGRTGGSAQDFDFDAIFKLAAEHPHRARILAIFLPSRPDHVGAYIIGTHDGGDFAEYVSAGSVADPELRKTPFNYILLWDLIEWAHGCGAKSIDLGGITPGGPDDPRATISEFKRHFCDYEIEISREFVATLQPVRAYLFDGLIRLRTATRRKPRVIKPPTHVPAAEAAVTPQ